MQKSKILKIIFATVLMFIGIFIVFTGSTYAVESINGGTSIKTKAALEGVWQCQQRGAYAISFKASEFETNFVQNHFSDVNPVKLPYLLTDEDDENEIDCYEVMFGFSAIGVIGDDLESGFIPKKLLDMEDWTFKDEQSRKSIAEFFAGKAGNDMANGNGGIGYKGEKEKAGPSDTGIQLRYYIDEDNTDCNGTQPTIELGSGPTIFYPDIGNTIVFPTIIKTDSGISFLDDDTAMNVPPPNSGLTYRYITSCGHAYVAVNGTTVNDVVDITIDDESSGDDIKYKVSIRDGNKSGGMTEGMAKYKYYDITDESYENGEAPLWEGKFVQTISGNVVYKFTMKPQPIRKSITDKDTVSGDYILTWGNNLSRMVMGLNSKNEIGYRADIRGGYNYLALTRQEVYDLYKYYVKTLGISVICEKNDGFSLYENNISINWRGDSRCVVYNFNNAEGIMSSQNVYGVYDNFHFGKRLLSIDDIVNGFAQLGDLCSPKLNGVEGCDGKNGGGDDDDGTTTTEENCDQLVDKYTDGDGIGAMQWVLCPSLNNSMYTADWIDGVTQDWLEVKSDMYKPGDSDAYTAWGFVQNVANVIMVLFLLIIIISQITGYGIDNYGIKKMLPRLVVMAIIVNLSFYICALAIDLSNIAGIGLRDLFGSIGSAVDMSEIGIAGRGEHFVQDAVVGVFGAAGLGGSSAITGASMAMTLGGGIVVAIVVALIILVLVIIVAVVILYLMLGVREVIILFCIVVSPLAFAAFILPNTQHLFKKWWELFKAAIIIFPICGALSGISYLLRNIKFESEGIATQMILMVLPYVSFFLLPMLIKQAIAALGKLGGALTALGSRMGRGAATLGRGAMHGIQNSEAYKNRAEQAAWRRKQNYNAGLRERLAERQERRRSHGRELSATDRRRLYGAQSLLNAHMMEQSLADAEAPELAPETAHARALSVKEAQEIKGHTDQWARNTNLEFEDILNQAVDDYRNDRNEANAIRLQAAIMEGDRRGMSREMLGGHLADLSLDQQNGNDASILRRMSESSNTIISQTAKAHSKAYSKRPAGSTGSITTSINGFMTDSGTYGMKQTFMEKDANIATTMDDDTLEQLYNKGAGNLTAEQIVQAGISTRDPKKLKWLNQMLEMRNSGEYEISTAALANVDPSMAAVLKNNGMANKAVSELKASPNSDASRQILDNMAQATKDIFGL